MKALIIKFLLDQGQCKDKNKHIRDITKHLQKKVFGYYQFKQKNMTYVFQVDIIHQLIDLKLKKKITKNIMEYHIQIFVNYHMKKWKDQKILMQINK